MRRHLTPTTRRRAAGDNSAARTNCANNGVGCQATKLFDFFVLSAIDRLTPALANRHSCSTCCRDWRDRQRPRSATRRRAQIARRTARDRQTPPTRAATPPATLQCSIHNSTRNPKPVPTKRSQTLHATEKCTTTNEKTKQKKTVNHELTELICSTQLSRSDAR